MSLPRSSPDGRARRRRSWLLLAIVVVVVVVFVASRIELNDYVLTPGVAQPVNVLIHVPHQDAHRVEAGVYLTDVSLARVSLLDYLPDLLAPNSQLVPSDELLGPGTSPDELVAQGYLEMAQAQAAAKAAALRTLGYVVPEHDGGAVVFSVAPGSPAAGALRVGQIVTAVDGRAVTTSCGLIRALHDDVPGQRVRLTVERTTLSPTGALRPGQLASLVITLARRPSAISGQSQCPGVRGPSKAYLGVAVETQQDFRFPLPISIDTSGIGGPSAGLALTLGILDVLGGGDLTGGHRVAATGTIDPSGAVGDVGGVPQKTVAVEEAGATDFLVPPQEYRAAMTKATPSLHVYAVSSLGQALQVLRRLGGKLEKPSSGR